jgi:hypothetical protein
MNATFPTVEELIGKDFVKRGDWTEERREVLKNLTGEEIDAAIMQSQTEHPEGLFTPEELQEMAMQLQQTRPVGRRTEAVGA